MQIDYFCFSVPSLDEHDFNITEEDNENTRWIKNKDLEMMNEAKDAGMLIVFNREDKRFYKNRKEFDVKDKIIFPKAFIFHAKELLLHLQTSQAKSLFTLVDYDKIISWPLFVKPKHRKLEYLTYGDFQSKCEEFSKNVGNQIFLKTALKSHKHYFLTRYGKINFGEMKLFYTHPPIMNIEDDEKVIVSEIFKNIEDKQNKMDVREYRCFAVQNQLLSISRSYIDYPTPVPSEVKKFALSIIEELKSKKSFPSTYAFDLTEMEIHGKRAIDIVEFNPPCSCGYEVCNNLVEDYLKIKNQTQSISINNIETERNLYENRN